MLLFTHMGAYETGNFTNDTIIDLERVQKTWLILYSGEKLW